MGIPHWAFYAVLLLFVLIVLRQLEKVMREDNPIEWWQFIATKRSDGVYRADITKLGQAVGIFIASWVVIAVSARVDKIDAMGFCAVFSIYLIFVAGVAGFQEYMKNKRQQQASTPDSPETKETA